MSENFQKFIEPVFEKCVSQYYDAYEDLEKVYKINNSQMNQLIHDKVLAIGGIKRAFLELVDQVIAIKEELTTEQRALVLNRLNMISLKEKNFMYLVRLHANLWAIAKHHQSEKRRNR